MPLYEGVTLQFYLKAEVTPELFAKKVALACAKGGAIRIGERVVSGLYVYEYVDDEETSMKEIGLGTSEERILIPLIEEIHVSAQREERGNT